MKCKSLKSVNLLRLRSHRSAPATCSAIAVLSVLVPCAALAQTQARHSPPLKRRPPRQPNSTEVSPPPALPVTQEILLLAQLANERLIAVALSELARLRMIQQAYPQAVEL